MSNAPSLESSARMTKGRIRSMRKHAVGTQRIQRGSVENFIHAVEGLPRMETTPETAE